MKAIIIIFQIFLFVFVLIQTGCEQPQLDAELPSEADVDLDVSTHAAYVPSKIEIMPLTGFISPTDVEAASEISVYVSLLDPFGCQMKSPGVFRFEIYEHVQRSAEPKGRRIAIWPDTDLIDAVENNKYWRDFLRAYQFNLPLESADSQSYILQVTFMCPTGKRLTGEFTLKRTK
jgi:hypothetical protein